MDPIIDISCSEKHLIILRKSGTIVQNNLPAFTFEAKYSAAIDNARQCFVNCDSTIVAALDGEGTLKLGKMPIRTGILDVNLISKLNIDWIDKLERKEVWEFQWSKDEPHTFVSNEKGKLYIVRQGIAQGGRVQTGFVAQFSDMVITMVAVEELMKNPDDCGVNTLIRVESDELIKMKGN